MYQVGDLIIYGDSGVCRVTAIGEPAVSHIDKTRPYYTLTPVYGAGVIHIPVDTKVFMRPILTHDEAEQLIREIPSIRGEKVSGGSQPSAMSEQYQASLQSHECSDLVQLIKTIYEKNTGRKPGKTDEKYRKRAEELLYGELAVALGIERERVVDFIVQSIEGSASA